MKQNLDVTFNLHLGAHQRCSSMHLPEREEPTAVARGRLPRITQVLALAIHIQELVRKGEVQDYAEFSRKRQVTRERISQILKLVWLAPDIQTEILYLPPILGGRYPISELSLRPIADLLSWKEQGEAWMKLKRERRLIPVAATKEAAG